MRKAGSNQNPQYENWLLICGRECGSVSRGLSVDYRDQALLVPFVVVQVHAVLGSYHGNSVQDVNV